MCNKSQGFYLGQIGSPKLRKARPKEIKEVDIEKEFVRRVALHQGLQRKLRWLDRRGAPDRFVVLYGIVYLVELKRPGAVPRPEQQREHARLRRHGLRVFTISDLRSMNNFFESAVDNGDEI